jgi:hypothetical protein
VVDVCFDSSLAKHQPIGDFATRQTLGNQRGDLPLTRAEAIALAG